MSGRIIVVHHRKGGVGKTTLSVHLAGALAGAGMPTLLIDGDLSQGSATQALGQASAPGTEQWLLTGQARPVTARPHLDLLPSAIDDHDASARLPEDPWTIAARMEPWRAAYRWIVVDTPPTEVAWINRLMAQAEAILVPVELTHLSLVGLVGVLKNIPPDRLIGMVPMKVDSRTRRSQDLLQGLRETAGTLVAPGIRVSVDLERASGAGRLIWEWDPTASVATDIARLMVWISEQIAERSAS